MSKEQAATWTKIEELTPWADNPRQNAEAVAEVAKSIRRFGFASPIVANSRDNTVIAGHTRLEAAKRLELDQVPVRWMDLDPVDAKVLALADNRLGEIAKWDETALAQILQDIATVDDTALSDTGFSDKEMSELVGDISFEDVADPKPSEPPEEPVSRVGEIYELGPHRLVCGDCKGEVFAKLAPSCDAVLSDPPYGMKLDTDYSVMEGDPKHPKYIKGKSYDAVIGDGDDFDPYHLMEMWPKGEMFLFGADYYAERIPGKNDGSWLVWDKRKESMADGFGSEFELVWSRVRHKRRMLRFDWFVYFSSCAPKESINRLHPTQKPTPLIADIMNQWLPDGCVVADPYLGSGTTLIAAAQTGRVCYGAELSPAYCDVIRKRWAKWAIDAGQDPGTGALDG